MQEKQQDPLFVNSINEALKESIKAMGGAKAVGQKLKLDMSADDAGRWLSDCLNPDRRDKLNLGQLMWILREARKVGCHIAINYICDDCAYSRPQPIEPEDEKAALQREFIEASKHMSRMAERIALLSGAE